MSDTLSITAPAKVNLALSVGTPDADTGMHPICSWMVTVDLVDDLSLVQLDPESLSRYAVLWHDDAPVRTEIDWSITDDLAVRAHLALEQHVGHALPVQMTLRKRIPVGSGLGGGSADAAAMLRACNAMFNLQLDSRILSDIALALGSDVPFMVHGGSATVQATGGDVTVHDSLPNMHIVLVLPDATCSTAAVYRRFDDTASDATAVHADRVADVRAGVAPLFNDLAASACLEAPVIAHLSTAIESLVHRTVHVSGSGSTVFLTCDTALEATAMAHAIASEFDVPTLAVSPVCASSADETRSP